MLKYVILILVLSVITLSYTYKDTEYNNNTIMYKAKYTCTHDNFARCLWEAKWH